MGDDEPPHIGGTASSAIDDIKPPSHPIATSRTNDSSALRTIVIHPPSPHTPPPLFPFFFFFFLSSVVSVRDSSFCVEMW